MKMSLLEKISLPLAAFVFSSFLLFNESKVEWLSPLTHDFGDIPQGKPVKVDFRFKNISDEVLTIDNVRTACTCTATDWSDEVIEPGKNGSLEIEYDALKPGYFQKKITVYFSGQRKAEKLYIEGFVE